MKLSKIVERVNMIREIAARAVVLEDHELCARLERELLIDVLHADAMGKGSPAKSAAALEATEIKFTRRDA